MLGAAPGKALIRAVACLLLLVLGAGIPAHFDARGHAGRISSPATVRVALSGVGSGLGVPRRRSVEDIALAVARRVSSTSAVGSPVTAPSSSAGQKSRLVAVVRRRQALAAIPQPLAVDRRLAAYEMRSNGAVVRSLPRLWAVQVRPGARGWFDRALLKRVRKDGINALTLRVSNLGRTAAGRRTFDRVRAFAAAEKLYLIAVLRRGEARTPVGRHALAACSKHPSARLRCAVSAPSAVAAAALARKQGSVKQLVVLYVRSPGRVARLTGVTAPLSRRILVIAPLHRRFDGSAWGAAIGESAVSASVFMGAAPQTPKASPALQQLAATLAGGTRRPPSTPSTLTANGVTKTSMTLAWKASTDIVGVVGYRLFRNGVFVGTSASTSFPFNSLSCGTSYTLGVAALDRVGNTSRTASLSHSTSACSDTQPPSTPSGLATSGVGQTTLTLSWKASSDDIGVVGYRLSLNGSQVGTSATTSYMFTGLTCGTSYTFAAAAYDEAGNVSGTASVLQSTGPCADTQSPSTPSGLVTGSVAQKSMTLSWNASTDNVGVAGYQVFLNGSQVGTAASPSFSFTGLTCATGYTLGVAAYDAAGNVSGTATVSRSTSVCTDSQPPSTPSGLATSSVTQTAMKLSWNASSDNVGIAGYRLFLNGGQVGTSATTSFNFAGLTCGTSYTLGVAAYDAAGNVSGTAATTGVTSACASGAGLANLFVSPTGSDSGCSRSSSPIGYAQASGHVCASPAKACKLAQSGDTVILEDGTYKSHMDGCAEGHQSYAQNVVFEPEPGHECPMTYPNVPVAWSDTSCDVNISGDSGDGQFGLSLGGNDDTACGVTGHPLPSTLSSSQMATWDTHLTFKGIYVGEMTAICSADVNLTGVVGTDFFLREGIYNWTISGSDFGNDDQASVPTIGDSLSSGTIGRLYRL